MTIKELEKKIDKVSEEKEKLRVSKIYPKSLRYRNKIFKRVRRLRDWKKKELQRT